MKSEYVEIWNVCLVKVWTWISVKYNWFLRFLRKVYISKERVLISVALRINCSPITLYSALVSFSIERLLSYLFYNFFFQLFLLKVQEKRSWLENMWKIEESCGRCRDTFDVEFSELTNDETQGVSVERQARVGVTEIWCSDLNVSHVLNIVPVRKRRNVFPRAICFEGWRVI